MTYRLSRLTPIVFTALLAGCGVTAPAEDPATVLSTQAPMEALLTAQTSGQDEVLKFGTAELLVPAGAVPPGTPFRVKKLPIPQNELVFPSGSTDRTHYFLREVEQRKLIGVYRIQTNAAAIQQPLTLRLHIGGKPLPGTQRVIEQIFAKDNVSGEIKLASVSYGEDRFSVPDVLSSASTSPAGQKDVTYYVYRTDFQAYDAACQSAGGSTEDDFCSFLNKTITPNVIKPLATAPNLEILSWNVGNANAIAQTGCGGPYNVKLCFIQNEVLVANYITERIQNGIKPDIIFFQELWHGRCAGINDTNTARVCGTTERRTANVHQIKRVAGTFGANHIYRCIPPTSDVPAKNGYECIAVNSARFSFAFDNTSNILETNRGFIHQPFCEVENFTPNPGEETGSHTLKVVDNYTGQTLSLVNGHFAAPPFDNCRTRQIQAIRTVYGVPTSNKVILAGDWNTEPRNDSTDAGNLWRQTFAVYGTTNPNLLANTLDNDSEPTAYTSAGSSSLDHVMSNTFVGSCSRLPAFEGQDHRRTNCYLRPR